MPRRLLIPLALLLASTICLAGPPPKKPDPPALHPLRIALNWTKDPCDPQIHVRPLLPPVCFDPLYIWESGENGLAVKPCLAEGWPSYSDDGLTCTIRLRANAGFEDASPEQRKRDYYKEHPEERIIPLTAKDVLFTLKRAAKYRNYNSYTVIQGLIAGLEKMPAAKWPDYRLDWDEQDDAFEPDGIRIVDERTLTFTLTRPTRLLPVWLANPCFCVVSPTFMDRDATENTHLHLDSPSHTSGPFSYGHVWNADWAFEPKAPSPALAPRHIIDDDTSYPGAIRAMDDGKLDYSFGLSIPGSVKPEERDPRIRPVPLELMYYLAFNMKDKTWGGLDTDGRALRKAVSLAFERRKFAQNWTSTSDGYAGECDSALPRRRGAAGLGGAGQWSQGSAQDARDALKDSAWEKMPEEGLKLRVATGAKLSERERATIDSSLKAIDIRIDWIILSEDEFRKSVAEGNADAWLVGWMNDSPHPAEFLRLLSSYHAMDDTGTALFPGGYSSEEFNDAFRRLEELDAAHTNLANADQAASAAIAILEKDRPYVPLVELYTHEAVAPGVRVPEIPLSCGTLIRQLNR